MFDGPGIQAGSSDALVYLLDLLPTLCDLAGAKVPANINSASLALILHGEKSRGRKGAWAPPIATCNARMPNERWKLIRYPQVNRTQLFDLQNDPDEMRNLADDPGQAERIARHDATFTEVARHCRRPATAGRRQSATRRVRAA